jgi:hypothetical protein
MWCELANGKTSGRCLVGWAFATKINKPPRHAEVLSKYGGDSCQSSLQLDSCCCDRRLWLLKFDVHFSSEMSTSGQNAAVLAQRPDGEVSVPPRKNSGHLSVRRWAVLIGRQRAIPASAHGQFQMSGDIRHWPVSPRSLTHRGPQRQRPRGPQSIHPCLPRAVRDEVPRGAPTACAGRRLRVCPAAGGS